MTEVKMQLKWNSSDSAGTKKRAELSLHRARKLSLQ